MPIDTFDQILDQPSLDDGLVVLSFKFTQKIIRSGVAGIFFASVLPAPSLAEFNKTPIFSAPLKKSFSNRGVRHLSTSYPQDEQRVVHGNW